MFMPSGIVAAGQRVLIAGDGNSYQDTAAGGGNAVCAYRIESDGDEFVRRDNSPASETLAGWIIPRSASANTFWVRFTAVSGTPSSGATLGVWHALTTTREQLVSSSSGGKSFTFDVDIARDSGGTDIVASGRIIITAVRT